MNIEMKSKVESSEKVLASKLNFVDLAGSERVKKTGSTGIALKEATYINKSLTFLEQVVVALTDKTRRKDYIPYRQSKLTHILKDSIGGNCKTCMIATIWPEEPFILETLSTLNFAKRMKNVVNDISVNTIVDTNAYLKKLQREIKDLKQELLMHNTLANRGNINYDPYTPEEQYVQQQIALRFLNGENEDIDFDSVRQAKELFNQCRIIFQKEFTAENLLEDKNKNNVERKDTKNSIEKQKSISDAKSGVGEFIEKPSFGIGRAPKDARPVYSNEQPNNLNNTLRESQIINENAYVSYNDFVEEGGDKNINIQDNLQKKNLSNENADVILRNDNDDFEEEISEENIPDKNSAFALYKNENETAKKY
jgi:kinesin family protein 6/9